MHEPLASYDPDTCSWRTSQHSLFEGSTVFSETWPRSGTMRSGIVSRRRPLAPLTAATGSGSWPTPAANLHNYFEDPDNWLARRERLRSKGINGNGAGMPLGVAVRLWPTPTRNDYKGAGYQKGPAGARFFTLPGAARDSLGRPYDRAASGHLNPTWVEWLMGYPLGWTDLEDSETP